MNHRRCILLALSFLPSVLPICTLTLKRFSLIIIVAFFFPSKNYNRQSGGMWEGSGDGGGEYVHRRFMGF